MSRKFGKKVFSLGDLFTFRSKKINKTSKKRKKSKLEIKKKTGPINKKHKCNVSIEDVLGADDEENEIRVGDLSYDDEENVENIVEQKIVSQDLDKILKKYLSPREYEIMCLRYGLLGKPVLTQREVAKKLNISRSYISRLEKKSIEILRKVLNKRDYGFN